MGAALGCYHRDVGPVVSHQATNAKIKKAHLMVSLFQFGSGGWIRTNDLRVMSPTSYQTAPPRINTVLHWLSQALYRLWIAGQGAHSKENGRTRQALQHFLYFLPLPQLHGSLRPTLLRLILWPSQKYHWSSTFLN